MLLKLLPIILIFILGFVLKKIGLLRKKAADLFLKVVFFVSVPALILTSVSSIKLSFDFIYLPIIVALIIFITFLVSSVVAKVLKLERKTKGSFLVGTMIMNTGFLMPFVIAIYGNEGFARIAFFDVANAFLTFTFIYLLACKFGSGKEKINVGKKLLSVPPLYALVVALAINFANYEIPSFISSFLEMIGNLTVPLILLSLGIYFSIRVVKLVPLISALVIRMAFGLLLGFVFVKLFALSGLNAIIVMLSAAAPIGYNTIIFSSLENLDKEFAASLVSIAILLGMIFIPILMALLA